MNLGANKIQSASEPIHVRTWQVYGPRIKVNLRQILSVQKVNSMLSVHIKVNLRQILSCPES